MKVFSLVLSNNEWQAFSKDNEIVTSPNKLHDVKRLSYFTAEDGCNIHSLFVKRKLVLYLNFYFHFPIY